MLKEINRYIEYYDMIGLRYIFLDCLDVDPTFEKYKEGYDRVKTIDGFFEDYVELHPLVEEKEKWNEDYWIQLKNDLKENFSEKRFTHMREVAKVYFSDKISKLQLQRQKLEEARERKKLEQTITEQKEKNKGASCLNEDKLSVEEEQKIRLEQKKKELEAKNKEIERHIKKQKQKVENQKKEYVRNQSKKDKEIALVLGIVIIIIIAIIAVLKME